MQRSARCHPQGTAGMVVGILLLSTACDSDSNGSQIGFTTWDSAGIAIAETSSASARATLPWQVSETPDLQLGQATGDPAYEFAGIAGVQSLPGGAVLVVDGGSAELRFFGPSGDFLYARGGRGSGPGEFQAPLLLQRVEGDSLLIFDSRQRRFSLMAPEGDGSRSDMGRALALGLLAGSAQGVVNGRAVFTSGSLPTNREEGPLPMRTSVRWVDLESQRADTLLAVDTPYHMAVDNGVPFLLEVPFGSQPAVAVESQRILIAASIEPEILEYDEAGQLRRILRIAEPARPILSEEFSGVIEALAQRSSDPEARASIRALYGAMELPDFWPPFQSLMIDETGWVWAEAYRPVGDSIAVWTVFDENGQARGSLVTPEGLQVGQIGLDFILGTWRDDLGVEYVRRYSLDRGRGS